MAGWIRARIADGPHATVLASGDHACWSERGRTSAYPRPFWILFSGSLVNSSRARVWSGRFLTIYVRELLGVPLTTVTLLFTFNSVAGLIAMSFVGPAVDRFGRKRAMVLGLAANCVVLFSMSLAHTWAAWAVLMALWGALGPLYRVGADAMVADLTKPERRVSAYSLLRVAGNLGFAIGPAIGGFITSVVLHGRLFTWHPARRRSLRRCGGGGTRRTFTLQGQGS